MSTIGVIMVVMVVFEMRLNVYVLNMWVDMLSRSNVSRT